jgi:flagellar biosynthesis GTPase FlhF
MKLKSYFSGTVEAALELASKELGEDALLIHARPATPETRWLGAFEVVFGVPDDIAAPGHPRESSGGMQPPANGAKPGPGESWEDIVSVDATLGVRGAARKIVALIGPPGAGKTTTAVKLAARAVIANRRAAHFLLADRSRIGAAEQLKALASAFGAGFRVAETPKELAQALDSLPSRDFVFIDTPGFARAEMPDARQLANVLASRQDVDTHLILPASMQAADLARTADRFELFRPNKLIAARLDETECVGPLLNESLRRNLPFSFLCSGPRIPEDVEPATAGRVARLVLGRKNASHPVERDPGADSPPGILRKESKVFGATA